MEEQINTKELEQLEEINKDITKIEQKLEAIPGAAPLDMTKYNRKQRRQLERNMKHNEKEKQKDLIQKGNTFVTRREFVGLFQSMQKLRDRMYYIDVLTAAMEKLLIEKNIFTEEELKNTIKSETEKALAFQDIQKGQKDYETRIKKCLELGIDPNISVISQQIYEDAEMPLDEKKELAKTYNLEVLLKIFSDNETQKST
jgi:hypothetical protein